MYNLLDIFLLNFLYPLLVLSLFLTVGGIIRSFIVSDGRVQFLSFDNLFLGVLLLTSAYAIWISGFDTLLSPILLFFVFIYILPLFIVKKLNILRRIRKKLMFLALSTPSNFLLLLFFLGINSTVLTLLNGGAISLSGAINEQSSDFSYYARCSEFMVATGIESCSNDRLFPGSSSLYHFGELWLLALFSTLFGDYPSLLFLLGSVRVFMLTAVLIGIIGVVRGFQPRFSYSKSVVIAYVILCISPLYFFGNVEIQILRESYLLSWNTFDSLKLIFPILSFFYLAQKPNFFDSGKVIFIFSAVALAYPPISPPLLVVSSVLIFLRRSTLSISKVLALGFIVSISFLWILQRYLYGITETLVDVRIIKPIEYFSVTHFPGIFFGSILLVFILHPHLPALFTSFLLDKIRGKVSLSALGFLYAVMIIFLALLIALLSWAFLPYVLDSVQFFQNILIPISIVSIPVFVMYFFGRSLFLSFTVIVFVIAGIFSTFLRFPAKVVSLDPAFLESVRSHVDRSNGIYLTVRDPLEYSNLFAFFDKSNNIGNFISYLRRDAMPVSVDLDQALVNQLPPQQRTYANRAIHSSTFYMFQAHNQAECSGRSCVSKFIRDYDVSLAVVRPHVAYHQFICPQMVVSSFDDLSTNQRLLVIRPSDCGKQE